MKKQIGIGTAFCCASLCIAALSLTGRPVVQAKEQSAEEKGILQEQTLVSRGNLIYRDSAEEAGIYAADFSLLYGKLSAVSGEVFDPAEYTHIHQWEYKDANDSAHTRHCILCRMELADKHRAENEEDCTIVSGDREFCGRRYQCICGYQWEREAAHTLTFDIVDETCHRSRCLLDGTAYCPGYEPIEEEHYAFSHTLNPSGTHYTKACIDCGYQTEEEVETENASVSENSVEDMQSLELSEAIEKETTRPEVSGEEMPESSEIIETETSQTVEGGTSKPDSTEIAGGEASESKPDEQPPEQSGLSEGSVSGNDCVVEESQIGMEEQINQNMEEKVN